MLEELRLYPWAPADRAEGGCAAGGWGMAPRPQGRILSTGFAERPELGSTGVWTPSCSAAPANAQAGRRWV